jgi:hypothetical protein
MSSLEIAVVVPLEDPRGDVVDHLRSWTDRQTLARDRYQLVAGTDGEHPEFERQVSEILRPQDAIVTVPGGSLMELYAAAAQAARADVLVFTEAHCHAEPACLAAAAELFASRPDVDAAQFHQRQETHSDFGKLSERWFERSYELWRRYDWTRLKVGGSAISADAYERAGGIDPEMDLFAPFFLSARVNQLGGGIERLDQALVTHVLEDEFGEDLSHSGRYARGECIAREKHDPQFMARYFGAGGLWDRRFAYRPEAARALTAALASAARRSPRDAPWLARELIAHLPARIAGPRPRRSWESAMVSMHRRMTESRLVPFERRWRSYISATEHLLQAVQLSDGTAANGSIRSPAGPGALSADQLEGVLVGAHGLEHLDGRALRWTEPAALLRLNPPPDGAVVRIDTGGLRGAPHEYLHGIYASGRPLPPELLSSDDGCLEIRLPEEFARAAADSGLVLISRPLVPSRNGSIDHRRLGMPFVALDLGAL